MARSSQRIIVTTIQEPLLKHALDRFCLTPPALPPFLAPVPLTFSLQERDIDRPNWIPLCERFADFGDAQTRDQRRGSRKDPSELIPHALLQNADDIAPTF